MPMARNATRTCPAAGSGSGISMSSSTSGPPCLRTMIAFKSRSRLFSGLITADQICSQKHFMPVSVRLLRFKKL